MTHRTRTRIGGCRNAGDPPAGEEADRLVPEGPRPPATEGHRETSITRGMRAAAERSAARRREEVRRGSSDGDASGRAPEDSREPGRRSGRRRGR
jgi:hypothetical protein